MTPQPLPVGVPTEAQVLARLGAARRALEALHFQMGAAMVTAHLYVQQLMTGDTPPEAVLAALRTIHATATAMEHPASEVLTMVLETGYWAERVSLSALAVPLVETEPTPADIADRVEEWLGSLQPGGQLR